MLIGCEKELIETEAVSEGSQKISTRSSFVSSGQKAILGNQFNHPFTKSNVITAYNYVYNTTITSLPTTHRYVKFEPLSDQENKLLQEDENLVLSYIPFDYEIIQMGKFLHLPELGRLDPLYSVVPIAIDISSYNYTLLDELHYDENDVVLQARALNNIFTTDTLGNGRTICEPESPDYPECACNELYSPGSPEWRDCIRDLLDQEPPPPPPSFENNGDPDRNYGCNTPDSRRSIAGCVTYEDSQFGTQPVKNVRVETLKLFGIPSIRYTDNNGCWNANRKKRFSWTRVWVRTVFRNNKTTVRSMRVLENLSQTISKIYEFGVPVFDHANIENYPVNTINIHFENNPDIQSNMKMYYYAAQALNSMEEFHEYADQMNITKPQTNTLLKDEVDVLITNLPGSAAAPMVDEMDGGLSGLINEAPALRVGMLTRIMALDVNLFLGDIDPLELPGGGIINWNDQAERWDDVLLLGLFVIIDPFIHLYAPDVVYNYGDEPARATDRIKHVFFHEYGHVSHYFALPSNYRDAYWRNNILRLADLVVDDLNDNGDLDDSTELGPYGDGIDAEAERTAIMESWAEHVGAHMSEEKYGSNNSFNIPSDNRYIYRLERDIPANRNFPWIPEGLYLDCKDNNATDYPPITVNDGISPDNVHGFTHSTLEAAVTNGTPETLDEVKQYLITEKPSLISVTDINTVFTQYGY